MPRELQAVLRIAPRDALNLEEKRSANLQLGDLAGPVGEAMSQA
jgi:hypothetical protein